MPEQPVDNFTLSFPVNYDAEDPTVITLPRFQRFLLQVGRQGSEKGRPDDDDDWYANSSVIRLYMIQIVCDSRLSTVQFVLPDGSDDEDNGPGKIP